MTSDSRRVRKGELFIPLQGPNFDGHRFIAEALGKGAGGSLTQQGLEGIGGEDRVPGKFLVRVKDVSTSLGVLARFWRRRQGGLKVVAITGSNGKTTTKDMAAEVLSGTFRVLKTEGNLNNLIGLPLMALRLSPEHQIAVLELGMNIPGEIARLAQIAEPEISLITNIGRAHLEFLGTLEGVARAKGELWEGLKTEHWIAVNADDPRVVRLAARANCRKKTFGVYEKADVRAVKVAAEEGRGTFFSLAVEGKERPVCLAAFGPHNVHNALGAASLASILGMGIEEIAAGLEKFRPNPGRGRITRLGENMHLLDETYNANPDSLDATLSAFSQMRGKSRGVVVMGDMLEIGPEAGEAHAAAGRRIAESGVGRLFYLGDMGRAVIEGALQAGMERQNIIAAGSCEEILEGLEDLLEEGDWVLVKGSRRMKMERVVEALIARLGEAQEGE